MSKPNKEPNGEVYKLPMMPIREMVIFPHMMTPVRRRSREQRARA